jgi:hypothetical protein
LLKILLAMESYHEYSNFYITVNNERASDRS